VGELCLVESTLGLTTIEWFECLFYFEDGYTFNRVPQYLVLESIFFRSNNRLHQASLAALPSFSELISITLKNLTSLKGFK
jgi:hypothetical protein